MHGSHQTRNSLFVSCLNNLQEDIKCQMSLIDEKSSALMRDVVT